MTRSSFRRQLLRVAAVLILVLLGGATYQGVSTALERRKYPRPGRMVTVGDHQLHLYCTGEGRPTVVLEAPAGGMSASWGWVQPAASRRTRVCSYDRAGLGWSEEGDRPTGPEDVPEELHRLLTNAREPGPYVIVGDGLGAAYAAIFASRHRADVAAVIFIDVPAPGSRDRLSGVSMMSPWLARSGILRAMNMLSHEADGLPEPAQGALRAFLNRPDHLTRAAAELARRDQALTLLWRSDNLGPHIEVRGTRDVAFLVSQSDAGKVSDAIRDAVIRLRR